MSLADLLKTAGPLRQNCWKRRGSDEESESSTTAVKRARYSWYVTLESESPQPSSSDEDESIYSLQGKETEYVQDTSDTSTNTWITSGDDIIEEYEPASLSANENPFIDCLSSSDPEISQRIAGYVGAIAAAICDSDLADDSDDSLTSRDSELSLADYWVCIQCNNNNNNPLFRYCEKCYQERKLFLPPRPKGKRRRKKSKKERARSQEIAGGHLLVYQDSGFGSFEKRIESETSSILELPGKSAGNSSSQDSGFDTCFSSSQSQRFSSQPGSSFSSQEDNVLLIIKSDDSKENAFEDIKIGSQESQDSVATTCPVSDKNSDLSDCSDPDKSIGQTVEKNNFSDNVDNKLCLMCTIAPKNATFIHGRDSHMCCCYRCAIKVWKTTKHCPICKRKVTDVVKVYQA